MNLPLEFIDSAALLFVRLTPKASSNKVGSIIADDSGQAWLKVYVTAVPEDGKANQALINLLSKKWKLSKSNFEIISGHTTRQKVMKVTSMPFEVLKLKVME